MMSVSTASAIPISLSSPVQGRQSGAFPASKRDPGGVDILLSPILSSALSPEGKIPINQNQQQGSVCGTPSGHVRQVRLQPVELTGGLAPPTHVHSPPRLAAILHTNTALPALAVSSTAVRF